MKSYRQLALERARKYIGTSEQPPFSNRGPSIDRWNLWACGLKGVYWCCSFVVGMFHETGGTSAIPRTASVEMVVAWARMHGHVVARPLRGDLACFGFDGPFDPPNDHIGIVERVLALRWTGGKFTGWIQTIEGNTSAQGKSGSQSNGGGVFRRRRWVRGINATFVRVPGVPGA